GINEADLGIAARGRTVEHGDNRLAIFRDLNGADANGFAQNLGGVRLQGGTGKAVTDAIALAADGPFRGEEPVALSGSKGIPLRTRPDPERWWSGIVAIFRPWD